eukprot:197621_1
MADYSKFDKMVMEEEEREKQEKEEERMRIRLKHEKEQKEKQKKWDEDLIKQGKDPVKERQKYGGCAFSHMSHLAQHTPHTHDENCNHDHDHKPKDTAPKSSCGYMPIEEIEKLTKAKQNEPTIAEKNKKKIEAVYAAKTDGNRLFKEENYELAYKVYERGVLIINGMYQMTEKEEDEMENVECLLDLNMAFASLKLENYAEAINCCKMAIQIDDKNAKAYYRWSEALIGKSDYDDARKQALKAKALQPNNLAIQRQLDRIDQLQKKQNEKAKKEEHEMAKRLGN